MQPEGVLPCSQKIAIKPYSQPYESNLCPHVHFFNIHLNVILHLRLCLSNGLFPSGFLAENYFVFLISPLRATIPDHLIVLQFEILLTKLLIC